MTDLREHFATAGAPRNSWTEARGDEQSLLGAMGMADALGAALWRLKYKGDPRVAKRCISLMAERLNVAGKFRRKGVDRRSSGARSGPAQSMSASMLERLAFRVIFEWINDRCTVCHGRGTLGVIGHVRACGHCKGACREPAQHAARARDIGVTMDAYRAHWEWRVACLLAELEALDEAVRCTVRGELKEMDFTPLKLDADEVKIAANAADKQSAA
jgi:hypothetical protein